MVHDNQLYHFLFIKILYEVLFCKCIEPKQRNELYFAHFMLLLLPLLSTKKKKNSNKQLILYMNKCIHIEDTLRQARKDDNWGTYHAEASLSITVTKMWAIFPQSFVFLFLAPLFEHWIVMPIFLFFHHIDIGRRFLQN